MSWALFVNSSGKPEVDLYAFARLGRIVSEHPTKPEADAALRDYRKKAEEEAKAALGQKELW